MVRFAGEVDGLCRGVAVLEEAEYEHALRAPARPVERPSLGAGAQSGVTGPVPAPPGEIAANLRGEGARGAGCDLRRRGVEDTVEVVGRDLADHPSHQEALHIGERLRDVSGSRHLPVGQVQQVHDKRIRSLGTPGPQPLQRGTHREIWFAGRMKEPLQMPSSPGQFDDLTLDRCLVLLRNGLQALLLSPVDLRLLDPFIAADDEVQPDEQLQFGGAKALLHRQPDVPVDVLTAYRQAHEQVVA